MVKAAQDEAKQALHPGGLGLRVKGSGLRVQGFDLVGGVGFRLQVLEFRATCGKPVWMAVMSSRVLRRDDCLDVCVYICTCTYVLLCMYVHSEICIYIDM